MIRVAVIDRITDLIVRSCDPQAVVLFGSFAKGSQDVHSDVDLLVVAQFRESHYLRGRDLRESLRQLPVRVDLHLLTPTEVEQQLQQPFGFLSSVLMSGVTLYGKIGRLSC